jgi:hypothetical protein
MLQFIVIEGLIEIIEIPQKALDPRETLGRGPFDPAEYFVNIMTMIRPEAKTQPDRDIVLSQGIISLHQIQIAPPHLLIAVYDQFP